MPGREWTDEQKAERSQQLKDYWQSPEGQARLKRNERDSVMMEQDLRNTGNFTRIRASRTKGKMALGICDGYMKKYRKRKPRVSYFPKTS